jgi:hypothetical protein
LYLEEHDETSQNQGEKDNIEEPRGLLDEFIPASEQGALDSVQVQDVDKMVHYLIER